MSTGNDQQFKNKLEEARSRVRRVIVYTLLASFVIASGYVLVWMGERSGWEAIRDFALLAIGYYFGTREAAKAIK